MPRTPWLKKARTKAKQKEWNGDARRTPIWGDPVAQDGENSQAQESLAMVVTAFSWRPERDRNKEASSSYRNHSGRGQCLREPERMFCRSR